MLNGIKFKDNFWSNQSTETNDPPKGRNLPHFQEVLMKAVDVICNLKTLSTINKSDICSRVNTHCFEESLIKN